MRALLFCLAILLLQVCNFCYGENDRTKQLSCFSAKQRMERLAYKLVKKFVREENKLSKLFAPEKGIKDNRDTKDVNLLKFVAAISGFHTVEQHKKFGKNSTEAIDQNKTALFKFIARMYTMIMDAPINGDKKKFHEFEPLFVQLRALREKVEIEYKHHDDLDKAPAPGQLGESVYQLFFMPIKALFEIEANNLHEHKMKGHGEAYDEIVNVMNFVSEVLEPNGQNENEHIDIFANPEKFQELLEKEAAKDLEKKKEAVKEAKKAARKLVEKKKAAGKIDEKEAKIEMEKIEKMNTTEFREIFRILANNAGYDVKKYDVKNEKEKEKLRRNLVKMLTNLYLCIWNSEIYSGTYKEYDQIYINILKVKDYYNNENEHKMNMEWQKELDEAKVDLDGRLKEIIEKIKKGVEKYDGFTEEWGWIYASDNFWDKVLKEENENLKEQIEIGKEKLQENLGLKGIQQIVKEKGRTNILHRRSHSLPNKVTKNDDDDDDEWVNV